MLLNLFMQKLRRRVYFDIRSSFDKVAKKIAGGGLKMMRTRHALTQRTYVLYMLESLHRHDVCRKSRNSVPTLQPQSFMGSYGNIQPPLLF